MKTPYSYQMSTCGNRYHVNGKRVSECRFVTLSGSATRKDTFLTVKRGGKYRHSFVAYSTLKP